MKDLIKEIERDLEIKIDEKEIEHNYLIRKLIISKLEGKRSYLLLLRNIKNNKELKEIF